MASELVTRNSQTAARKSAGPLKSKCNVATTEMHCNSSNTTPVKANRATDQNNVIDSGSLTMSVEMPEVIQPQEIECAFALIQRPQDEIMWSVGKVVQDFHKRDQFNDAVVKVANGEVKAHRHVLSASSQWMRDFIYAGGRLENFRQTTEIRIDRNLDASAVTQIVNYMYTARCRLNYFNVYSMFQAATYLQMPTLIAACHRLLAILMNEENLAIMLEIAEQAVGNALFVTFVYKQWVDKFYNQIQLVTFVEWPYQRMYRLLSNDHIAVHTEMDIFTAALRWINHDRGNRIGHFPDLMRIVRWVYLSQEELVQAVELEKLLIKNKEVKQLITDAQWYKTCQEHKHNWTEYKIPPSRILGMNSSTCPPGSDDCPGYVPYMPPIGTRMLSLKSRSKNKLQVLAVPASPAAVAIPAPAIPVFPTIITSATPQPDRAARLSTESEEISEQSSDERDQ
ncbi:putative Kelch-like protein 40b [Hypsibius exemplaris]|uniref:Kelch-like protein 40b n=1 Tax=Hypsibius exemplaris TaxID=2072580 RepID=A0A1W0WFF7_HYPEX|nr:putative Kelch-like protein 40b [Hypsibius exemplaris]